MYAEDRDDNQRSKMSNSKADTAEIDEDVEKYYWTPKSDISLDEFLSKVCSMSCLGLDHADGRRPSLPWSNARDREQM